MKKGLRTHHRQKERLIYIDCQIRSGHPPTAVSLAQHFEVSSRTIERDLEFLRDRMGAPLAYDRRRRGWYYTEPNYGLPAIQLTEGELIAIFLAEKVMQQYRGTPYERPLLSAFEKIVSALPEEISVDFQPLAEAYSFEIGPVSQSDAAIFAAVSRAVMDRQRMQIDYFSQSRGKMTERRVDPYHLHNYRGDWYVIAFDHLRGEVRDFHLGRLRQARETGETFQIPSDFNKDDYLRRGFSMVRGRKPVTVELEFDAYQARWIRERQKWHATEERKELPAGRLLLRLKVGGLDAVKRFVLQYGGHVVVRKPARLRRMVEHEIEKLNELYGLKITRRAQDRE